MTGLSPARTVPCPAHHGKRPCGAEAEKADRTKRERQAGPAGTGAKAGYRFWPPGPRRGRGRSKANRPAESREAQYSRRLIPAECREAHCSRRLTQPPNAKKPIAAAGWFSPIAERLITAAGLLIGRQQRGQTMPRQEGEGAIVQGRRTRTGGGPKPGSVRRLGPGRAAVQNPLTGITEFEIQSDF